ncbi:MAG: mechanosensitive ion channel [Wenzhouxiangella sp.]|nr:mechanosensitive ion channel [Wenzhouxiangella sp.]MDR9453737.1 mechanosensitive ion channel [Wenzhouxiangella sp.]
MIDSITQWAANFDLQLISRLGIDFAVAVVIVVIGRWVAKALVAALRRAFTKKQLDPLLIDFTTNILYVILLGAVVLVGVAYVGVDITPLMVLLGGSALAIGLALQSSLSNFASGLMLVAFRPFTQGHFVEAGGVSGTVAHVGIFNTDLVTPDNRHIVVPNSQITGSSITNYSAYGTRRIDLLIGVHYDDDLKLARDTIAAVFAKHDKVLDDPAPQILIMDLADSAVNIAARPWVNADDYWVVRSELLEQIKVALEAAGCSIPYPQTDLHIQSLSDLKPN